ncbi:Peptidase S54, rhomboid domain [Dillenia turbinata]|uniref:Peptidase S54, rhomboid domain n=1 Tax=Dillenia turbinata TaxID=194707 RepID=A0AAN8VIT3_9MAGN
MEIRKATLEAILWLCLIQKRLHISGVQLRIKIKVQFYSAILNLVREVEAFELKKNIGYSQVGLSYETAIEGHHWRIITSAFSHISILHLVFNMSALWSLGVVEQMDHMGLGVEFYLHYTLVLVVLSGVLVLGAYHLLIQKFKLEYFRRVTAVGYSCVVFGWMTILAVKQPSSKLDLFGFLSLPISFAPFESLIFTSIIVPQASFLGHLSGIIVGYSIGWGLIHGMNNYWALSMLGWIVLVFVFSLKQSGTYDFNFLDIESVTDPSSQSLRFLASGNGRTLQMSAMPLKQLRSPGIDYICTRWHCFVKLIQGTTAKRMITEVCNSQLPPAT